jgi:methylthioribose-1-phosphate isomerase
MPRPPNILWIGDATGHLQLLDQRQLPSCVVNLELRDVKGVYDAIRSLAVRGAPAIGVAAAYGLILAAQKIPAGEKTESAILRLQEAADFLNSSRPTAVNLSWSLRRCMTLLQKAPSVAVSKIGPMLLEEARAIHDEDARMCAKIARYGVQFVTPGAGVLTHCNTGYLAAGGDGTALAILYEAHRRGIPFRVFADETRPLLQGARLTTWELSQENIDVTLITDSMAAPVMAQRKVNVAIVGADRIAANGDTANKIGTYSVATLCHAHGIPFVVAAATSSFDLSLQSGDAIPIEQRDEREITRGFGSQTAPDGVAVYNPAFDVTPARLIHAIVTERGVVTPVTPENIRAVIEQNYN